MSESKPCEHGYVYGCPECWPRLNKPAKGAITIPDLRSTLEAKIKVWRERTEMYRAVADQRFDRLVSDSRARANTYKFCADEVEAILTAHQESPQCRCEAIRKRAMALRMNDVLKMEHDSELMKELRSFELVAALQIEIENTKRSGTASEGYHRDESPCVLPTDDALLQWIRDRLDVRITYYVKHGEDARLSEVQDIRAELMELLARQRVEQSQRAYANGKASGERDAKDAAVSLPPSQTATDLLAEVEKQLLARAETCSGVVKRGIGEAIEIVRRLRATPVPSAPDLPKNVSEER